MALETTTTSNKKVNPSMSDGCDFGQSATDTIGFYGATPVVQPSGSTQTAITDSSGGAANAATGVAALTGTYNSTIISNALATTIALVNKLRADLVSLGLIKGSA